MAKRVRNASQGARLAFGLAVLAAVAACWIFFAPTAVGGSTIYSVTAGNSMLPLIRQNDLVLVRPQSSYRVGEVVLYESPVLHRTVLHRILVIQNGHYFFKGDHNDFVDPGYATRAELLGKLWFKVPKLGGVVGWLGKPSHAALFAGAVALFVLLGSYPATRRRRRRRAPAVATAPPKQARRILNSQTRASLATFTLLLSCGALLLGVGFATPSHRTGTLPNAYTESGSFSYAGQTSKTDPAYPGGALKTGDAIFVRDFKSIVLRFQYRFRSALPHQIHGTIALGASIQAQSTSWKHLYTLDPADRFVGDSTSTGGGVAVQGLATLIKALAAHSGVPGDTYEIALQAIVHITGTVAGHQIRETFSPDLPFTATATVIKLDVAPATAPAGATYTPPTAGQSLAVALNPAKSSRLPASVTNFVTVARYDVSVRMIRLLGLILAGLALLAAAVHSLVMRRNLLRPLEEQLAEHYGCLLVPVDTLGFPLGSTPVELHDFRSLASLARYLERPILHDLANPGMYVVDDDTRHYVCRAGSTVAPSGIDRPPTGAPKRRGPAKRTRLPVIGSLGALLVGVTLATSFTASTSVPTSDAGLSMFAVNASQLAPGGCGSLSLTTIVHASGNYTNTLSNALVLGSSGNDNISDNGHNNCIIGGAGQDHINGQKGDYCEVGPTPGAKYNSCTAF